MLIKEVLLQESMHLAVVIKTSSAEDVGPSSSMHIEDLQEDIALLKMVIPSVL